MNRYRTRVSATGPKRIARALLVGLAAVMPAGFAGAAEETVQNDSLAKGQLGNIQLGFIAGESAAAWLTSPCDGDIVAVQVFWRSVTGTTGQTLEDSITIFADGVFPTPGAPLTVIEGPVMTDSVLNEFRYLDQNETIPLQVPVTTGQVFVVSFKFFNTPEPLDPSVVTDFDGCQVPKNSLFAIPGGWLNSCLLGVTGDFVIRAVIDCGALPEACCLDDGTCTVITADDCALAGGSAPGAGNCDDVECIQACCFEQGGCIDFDVPSCNGAGGFAQGAGTECQTVVCFPTGACCRPDGTCDDDVSPGDCAAGGGTYQGNDTLCKAEPCPQPEGACCFATGFCAVLEEAECLQAGISWAGPLTDCEDADMNGTADACEPCPADFNGDDEVGFQDLLAMLAAWGPCVACPEDIDGDDEVGFQDLLVLLAAWGACP